MTRAGRDSPLTRGPRPHRGRGPDHHRPDPQPTRPDPTPMMTTDPTDAQADLYAILGLDRSATQAEIARAYRTLLRRHHPDTRTSGDPSQDAISDAALQQILTAYAVLRDPDRRADYDQRYTPRPSRPSPTIAETGPVLVSTPRLRNTSQRRTRSLEPLASTCSLEPLASTLSRRLSANAVDFKDAADDHLTLRLAPGASGRHRHMRPLTRTHGLTAVQRKRGLRDGHSRTPPSPRCQPGLT